MLLAGNPKYKIILASNSPRRKELLSGLGIEYTVKIIPDIDESFPETLKGEEIPLYIARKKADAYKPVIRPDELVITADTIVRLDGETIGKPADEADAIRMLQKLSGKTHQVITGVCLTTTDWQRSFSTLTEVTFAILTREEIEYYVKNFHPFDKAGSYGVQEWIGFIGIESLSGSYYNVMGLPIQRLYRELKRVESWI
ncbi:Septum formation protein Maf [termite gut metagenome]|jgi:septum formation protein|uniref:Septum formation protein Maf n=1 Tax=termite gut metagenome TaxID=433724 RepID=A0A5J4Q971_9ZZZZ